jgi:hypothetical protein
MNGFGAYLFSDFQKSPRNLPNGQEKCTENNSFLALSVHSSLKIAI